MCFYVVKKAVLGVNLPSPPLPRPGVQAAGILPISSVLMLCRPWPKAVMEPREEAHPERPWKCFYFMGLKKKPQVLGQKNSVNLNTPVQEFKQQVCPVCCACNL